MKKLNTLEIIIKKYKALRKSKPDTWIENSISQPNLISSIEVSAKALNIYLKKHPHQYRVKKVLLNDLSINLIQRENDLKNAENFDAILKIVEASKSKGVGALTVYDTALRIGSFLQILPEKVYLHSGTIVGAKNLLKYRGQKHFILKDELPKEFAELTCSEIEDILCIYKNDF